MRKLQSRPENIGEVERIARILAERHQVDPELFPNLLISLTEAVNNAIHHGNNCDEDKFVIIRSRCHNGRLSLEVSDEGPGFDHTELPDPRAREHLEDCDGRGVLLMRELCDRIHYHDNGRTVELTFKLSRKQS